MGSDKCDLALINVLIMCNDKNTILLHSIAKLLPIDIQCVIFSVPGYHVKQRVDQHDVECVVMLIFYV